MQQPTPLQPVEATGAQQRLDNLCLPPAEASLVIVVVLLPVRLLPVAPRLLHRLQLPLHSTITPAKVSTTSRSERITPKCWKAVRLTMLSPTGNQQDEPLSQLRWQSLTVLQCATHLEGGLALVV